MDVKDGMLAEAIADEKKLDYFKNNAKETKAERTLLDSVEGYTENYSRR